MALIKCPECGREISDKAEKCIYCGRSLREENKHCPECGVELREDVSRCPNCGYPIKKEEQSEQEKPQKVEVAGIMVTKKFKIIVIAIIIALGFCGGIMYGVKQYQSKKAAEEYEQRVEEYKQTLSMATITMLSGAVDTENCGNLIKKVWSNAIYKEKDQETDQYTLLKNGSFVSDFNDALGNLFVDSNFEAKISKIKENQNSVNSMMKELKNPPEEYEDAYDAVSNLYDAYLVFTNTVISPSGSLQTFSNNFNDADSKTLNAYNAMELYLED